MPDLEVDKFHGINQKAREQNLIGPTVGQEVPGILELREALNVDISNRRSLRRREGFTHFMSVAGAHSAQRFGQLILCGSTAGIRVINRKTKSSLVVHVPTDPTARISWVVRGASAYWTNGFENGIIKDGANHPWGWPTPGQVDAIPAGSGSMKAGKYQVTISAFSGGIESGTPLGVEVTVPEGGGIQLRNLPQNADKFRIYVTTVNGSTFYHAAEYVPGTTEFILGNSKRGKQAPSHLLDAPPVGKRIAYRDGRIYISMGRTIVYTQPQLLNFVDLKHNYFVFTDEIKMIRPVKGGIFVDDGELYFIGFSRIGEVEKTRKLDVDWSVKEGTDIEVPASWFGIKEVEFVAFWWTDQGFPVIGMPNGMISPIGDDKIAIPEFDIGATLLREREGLRQLLTSFASNAGASGFGMSDSIEATVVTRGKN